MAKPNYQFEKRQRDLAKKSKQEEKRRQKLAGNANDKAGEGAAHDLSDASTARSVGTGLVPSESDSAQP